MRLLVDFRTSHGLHNHILLPVRRGVRRQVKNRRQEETE